MQQHQTAFTITTRCGYCSTNDDNCPGQVADRSFFDRALAEEGLGICSLEASRASSKSTAPCSKSRSEKCHDAKQATKNKCNPFQS